MMPNLAVSIRQKVIGLARREVGSKTQGLRKASAEFRKNVAELKRESLKLKSEVARMERFTQPLTSQYGVRMIVGKGGMLADLQAAVADLGIN